MRGAIGKKGIMADLQNEIPNVAGKVVIITGASSGIGEATAKLLGKCGAKVVLSARREDRLKAVAQEIGENAAYFVSDVTKLEDMQNLVAFAKQQFGKVDVMFANAGVMLSSNMSELRVNDWMTMVDVNVKGVLNSMAAVIPTFDEQKRGYIIVTSSVAGTRPSPHNAVYCGTKFFVREMLETFRRESVMEGTNIRTTAICPGAVDTELIDHIDDPKAKQVFDKMYAEMAFSADDIANAVLYCLMQPENVDVNELVIRPLKEGA